MATLLSKAKVLLDKPYPTQTDFPKNLPVILGFCAMATLFLLVFQPFGLNHYQHPLKTLQLIGVGGVCLIVLSFNYALIPKLAPRYFNMETWSVGREIAWSGWHSISTILVVGIYWSQVSGQPFTLPYISRMAIYSVFFTVLFMPACVLLNFNRLLRARLRKAEKANRNLEFPNKHTEEETIRLSSENGRDTLKMPVSSLLFMQSQDNYAQIVWQNNGSLTRALLRTSLRGLLGQLSDPQIVRCHRSFIVNLRRVRSVSGNARNYTLVLENCDQIIPVSRDCEKSILAAIGSTPCERSHS